MRTRALCCAFVTVGLFSCGGSVSDAENAAQSELTARSTAPFILFKGNTANGGSASAYSYRIPSLVSAGGAHLIAVAEARIDGSEDYGNINLVVRRSADNGKTWSAQEQIWNAPDRLGVVGNPTLVYDHAKDRVWLFASEQDSKHSLGGKGKLLKIGVGDRRTWARYTDDQGTTWSTPVNLTAKVTPPGYSWDAVGPGAGIALLHGPHAGRLVIPAKGRLIYSDDHGASWQFERTTASGDKDVINETTVAELSRTAGGLMVNARAEGDYLADHRRMVKHSSNGGAWTLFARTGDLLDPGCEGSILRYNFDSPARLIFFNPASTVRRDKMRVRISEDDGATWRQSRGVDATRGGYSSLAKTGDYQVAALYETGGDGDVHLDISFTRFNLGWIEKGD